MISTTKKENEEDSKFYTADLVTTATGSEDDRPKVVAGSMKPIDVESLPLEQQALLRALARESEKAEESGEIDGAEITITREQVDAELKRLREEKQTRKR
jgi:hypothetical protein